MNKKVKDLTVAECAAICKLSSDGCGLCPLGFSDAAILPGCILEHLTNYKVRHPNALEREAYVPEHPIKYLYDWQDWGLYSVFAVEVVEEDHQDPRYPNEKLSLVLSPRINGGRKPAIVPRKHLFDTYDEADDYGHKNTPSGAW